MADADLSIRKERVLRARSGWVAINFAELWRYRELFVFLSWRDVLVRYKQTYLGVAWAVLQPFLTMIVFSALFGRLGKFSSNGAPYQVVTLAALVPWNFFSNALTESSVSLVASSNMISKIYFPRLIVPSSAVLGGCIDFLIGLVLLFGTMIWYHVPFTAHLLLLPFFLVAGCMSAFAVGVWFSALNVKYRDIKYIVPFITRMGMYVSPVAFLSTVVLDAFGPRAHFFYCLNPMVGVIDGFRWCVLGSAFTPYWPGLWTSFVVTLVILITGLFYFRKTEKSFADII